MCTGTNRSDDHVERAKHCQKLTVFDRGDFWFDQDIPLKLEDLLMIPIHDIDRWKGEKGLHGH